MGGLDGKVVQGVTGGGARFGTPVAKFCGRAAVGPRPRESWAFDLCVVGVQRGGGEIGAQDSPVGGKPMSYVLEVWVRGGQSR